MIFSKGFIIWILLFSPCPSHQKAVMEKPLALAKIVEVSSSEEPTALALYQQEKCRQKEDCKTGMSAATVIGGTIAATGGALCPLSFGFGCAIGIAAASVTSTMGFSYGTKLCDLYTCSEHDIVKEFLLPQVKEIIANQQKLDERISYEAMETRLNQMEWMGFLNDEKKEILIHYAVLQSNTKIIMKDLQNLHDKLTSIQNEVERLQIIALYGDAISRLNYAWSSFNDLTKDKYGGIVDDYRKIDFLEDAKGVRNSMNDVVSMLTQGHPLKSESLWSMHEFCTISTYEYFGQLLIQSFILRAVSLKMNGHEILQSETDQFLADMVKIHDKFVKECSAVVVEMKQPNCRMIVASGYPWTNGVHCEVIDLCNPKLQCDDLQDSVPERRGSVEGMLGDTPIVCGGLYPVRDENSTLLHYNYTKKCYAIGHPTLTKTMIENRANADSVVLNDENGSRLWIIGGEDDTGEFNSTEFIELTSDIAIKGPELPFTITKHCVVQVNSTAIFLIGGQLNGTLTNRTWIINPKMNFTIKEGPTMNHTRWYPACGMRKVNGVPQIVVAGGRDSNQGLLKSVEILNVNPFVSNDWEFGPSMKYNLFDMSMITAPNGRGVILVGGKHDSIESTEIDMYPRRFMELQEFATDWVLREDGLKYPREGTVAFTIPLNVKTKCTEDMIGWNHLQISPEEIGGEDQTKIFKTQITKLYNSMYSV